VDVLGDETPGSFANKLEISLPTLRKVIIAARARKRRDRGEAPGPWRDRVSG
jgi:hypothetical protein